MSRSRSLTVIACVPAVGCARTTGKGERQHPEEVRMLLAVFPFCQVERGSFPFPVYGVDEAPSLKDRVYHFKSPRKLPAQELASKTAEMWRRLEEAGWELGMARTASRPMRIASECASLSLGI